MNLFPGNPFFFLRVTLTILFPGEGLQIFFISRFPPPIPNPPPPRSLMVAPFVSAYTRIIITITH